MENDDVWSSRQSDSLDLKPDPPPQESLFSNFPFFKDAAPLHQLEERSGEFLNSTDQYMREFLKNEPFLGDSSDARYTDQTQQQPHPSQSIAPTPFPGGRSAVRRFNSEPISHSTMSKPVGSNRNRHIANRPTPFPSFNHSLSAPTSYNHYSEQSRDRNEVPHGSSRPFPRGGSRPAPPGCVAKNFPSSNGGRDDHSLLIPRAPLSEMDRHIQAKNFFAEAKNVQKKKKRKHANYFVALQITNPSIKKKINAIQTALKNRSSKLVDNMIPIDTLHLVIGTLNLPCESDLWRAVEGFKSFGEKKLHDLLPHKTSCRLNIQGVENFKNRVLYATMQDGDPKLRLKRIHQSLRMHFQEIGLEGEYHKKFEPHLIICKTDGLITEDVLDCLDDFSLNFGFQFIHRLDFCAKSMTDFRYNVLTSISPKRSFV